MQQNLVNDTPAKKNYDFVDNIRCIAMMSIVMEHAVFFSPIVYTPPNQTSLIIFYTFIQLIKYGTVNFFLLSGFLIGEKFTDYSPGQYLKRRLDNTLIPWLFWSLVFLVLLLVDDYFKFMRYNSGSFLPDLKEDLPQHLKDIYLFSSFWFIPNFMICIAVLLLFKRYLYSYVFGGILLFFTLAYTVNIYFEWLEPRHSTAILGFVFFLWLGAQFNKNLSAFERWVNRTPAWIFLLIAIASLASGVKEELVLQAMHSVDPFNSLRISSIFYAISIFLLLLKAKHFNFISYLKPRETTYGIYLINYILVAQLLPLIFPYLKHSVNGLSTPVLVLYQLLRFVIVYIISFFMVTLINKTRYKWVVGR